MASLKGNINRYEIGTDLPFGKLNTGEHASKISHNDFTLLENLVKRRNLKNSLVNRYGMQRYNSNALSASNIINLFEAKKNDNYYLLGKDDAGASSSNLKYVALPYTGAWTSISATEYNSYYRFALYKDKVYIVNRINSGVLSNNKVWTGSTNLYDIGLNPQYTDTFTATVSASAGGLTTAKYYFYILTFLYDGYQESCSLNYVRCETSGGNTAISLGALSALSGDRVTAKKIYRSTGLTVAESSIPEDMYYLTTITDDTTNVYLDVKPDSGLGEAIPINTFFEQKKPYRSKYITVSKDRIILANLETDSTRYSNFGADALTPTESAGGSLTALGVYKYRLHKCWIYPSGGRYGFIVGNYSEVTKTLTGANQTLTVTVQNPGTHFADGWVNYILITRTVAGGSSFHYLTVQNAGVMSAGYADTLSDANLLAIESGIGIDIITTPIEEFSTNYKYRTSVAISEAGKGDIFPAENIKLISPDNNQGITEIFNENNRIIIFMPGSIHGIDTSADSSIYWDSTVLVPNIGASGQDTAPKTETVGHNGILQLPDDSGYIFFNRAYKSSSQVNTIIYYWNGNSDSMPQTISNDIEYYLTLNATIKVTGMCYDHINNWVWVTVLIGTAYYIFIYNLALSEWYIFTFNSNYKAFNIICSEEGKIIVSGDNGYIQYYGIDIAEGTKYYDRFYYSGALNYATYTAKLQTKSHDYFDADSCGVRFGILLDTTSTNSTSNTMVVGINSSENSDTVASSSGLYHKLERVFNALANRLYFRWENSEGKGIIIHKIYYDIKELHKASAGK